ncbi:MAG: hypothetical protein RLP09_27750 [Sandaracinaceae bacterium]
MTRPKRSAGFLKYALLLTLVSAAGIGGYLAWERWGGVEGGDDDEEGMGFLESVRVRVPIAAEPTAPRVIYLNREGATLVAGNDDSSQNSSSIVRNAGLSRAFAAPFAGTPRRWNAIVECVRDRFEPFDVQVVDQRPMGRSYIMVMVGGHPSMLDGGNEPPGAEHGHDYAHAAGLAPFNGQAVEDAVVLVFSRRLRENARRTCEVVSMEVGHAYGLDHSMHCGELMSYLRPCGRRRFRDEDLPCGEQDARECDGVVGGTTQNSYRRLLSALGPSE